MRRQLTAMTLAGLLAASGTVWAQDWMIEEVGEGTKPALVVDGSGRPHITFMTEETFGATYYAVRDADGWSVERATEGYFYAPMDLALDAGGNPYIYYHDHQALQFLPDLGDAVVIFKRDGVWIEETLADPGHDGWDGSIAMDAQGGVHVLAFDPVQFGGVNGVEYYRRDANGVWSVEPIGSGPNPYEFGTDLVLDDQGRPHVVYHDGTETLTSGSGADLKYAAMSDGGWEIQTVDSVGDVGKFASLALDSEQRPHIAYFQWDTRDSGRAKYARWTGSEWEVTVVGTLDEMSLGFIGARKSVSLALDGRDTPHIAFSDRNALYYAQSNGPVWSVQEVTGPSDAGLELGQLASMALDAAGQPHIAYYELPRNPRNSNGTIMYATMMVPTAVAEESDAETPEAFELAQNFPNPFNAETSVPFQLARASEVEISVYDLQGQLVNVLAQGHRAAGSYRVTWDGRDDQGAEVATGVYFTRMTAGEVTRLQKLLLLR